MKKSAMLQAFQVLGKKPMIFLLILPIQLVSVLNVLFIPDLSKFLDFSYMMGNSSTMINTIQMTNMLSILASSVTSLLSLVSMFILIPPAMELLSDGVAGRESASGWFMNGVRKHWWKPIVSSLLVSVIYGAIFLVLYIIVVVVAVAALVPLMQSAIGSSAGLSPIDEANSMLSVILPTMLVIIVVFGAIAQIIKLLISSVFGLFLPALTDRSFGAVFKLMFSKAGFRKLPKLFGGFLLIDLVPGLFYAALCIVYFLLTGIPGQPLDFFITLVNFVKSWEGILGMMLISVFSVLTYAFQFSVYQQVKDEETCAMIKQ